MKPGSTSSTIGVLAVQGSFDLHIRSLARLGVPCRKVRLVEHLEGLDGLIIPGGESTVMTGVASEYGLFGKLRDAALGGLPVFGTCAGAILLGEGNSYPERLSVVPVVVKRNAYGRQYESFRSALALAPFEAPFPGVFIRAPQMLIPPDHEARGIEVLGREGGLPILLRHRNCLLATFHPELTDDTRIHEYFLREFVGG